MRTASRWSEVGDRQTGFSDFRRATRHPRRFTLSGRLALLTSGTVFLTIVITLAVARLTTLPLTATAALALLVAVPAGLIIARNFSERITASLTALLDGVRGFRDEDFSLRLAVIGTDEISDLVRVYNEMGDVLRAQRSDSVQKELLLDTILQGTPTATILTNAGGRVVYANRAARDLAGRRLEGSAFDEIVGGFPEPLREAIAADRDVLFTMPGSDHEETLHVTRRSFHLNTQAHSLVMIERLTPEVRRQEVAVWKKAIRTINHELNNSLAPVSSLLHSVRQVAEKPEHAHRLEEMYELIDERLQHLRAFLEGYAEFARLPAPRKEPVEWHELLDDVMKLYPFSSAGGRAAPGFANVDRAQMQQALINLLKNAHESGSAIAEIGVEILRTSDGTQIRVLDRGRGMDEATRRQAILPFYSTKPEGTGLGLAICNEIVDAHGGRLSLHARDDGGTIVTIWVPD